MSGFDVFITLHLLIFPLTLIFFSPTLASYLFIVLTYFFLSSPHPVDAHGPVASCIIPCLDAVISLSCSTWEIRMEANRWWMESHPFRTERRVDAFFIPVHPTWIHHVPESRSPMALDDNPGFNYSWLRTDTLS